MEQRYLNGRGHSSSGLMLLLDLLWQKDELANRYMSHNWSLELQRWNKRTYICTQEVRSSSGIYHRAINFLEGGTQQLGLPNQMFF